MQTPNFKNLIRSSEHSNGTHPVFFKREATPQGTSFLAQNTLYQQPAVSFYNTPNEVRPKFFDHLCLKELTKFTAVSFGISSPERRPLYIITNRIGHSFSHLISRCSDFRIKHIYNVDDGTSSFGVWFKKENGSQGYFEIREDDLTSRNLFLAFIRAGGTFCIKSSDTKKGELLLSFISSLRSPDQTEISTHKFWLQTPTNLWLINEEVRNNNKMLNQKINLCEAECELLKGYAALKLRLEHLGVCLKAPILFLGEPSSKDWISINQREKSLERELFSSPRILNEVWLEDINDDTRYIKERTKSNLTRLMEFMKKHDRFDILVSHCLNEFTLGWLPIEPIHMNPENPELTYSWWEVCEAVRDNSESFKNVISCAIEKHKAKYGENKYLGDLIALACVSKTLSWFLRLKGLDDLSEQSETIFFDAIDVIASQWDAMDDEDDIERFSESLYQAVSNGKIFLFDKHRVPDSAIVNQIEAFYDENRLYITAQALKKALADMPDVSEPIILRILETAGFIMKQSNGVGKRTFSVKCTVYFANGESQRIRVLPLPRELFYKPGRVDITKITKWEEL